MENWCDESGWREKAEWVDSGILRGRMERLCWRKGGLSEEGGTIGWVDVREKGNQTTMKGKGSERRLNERKGGGWLPPEFIDGCTATDERSVIIHVDKPSRNHPVIHGLCVQMW